MNNWTREEAIKVLQEVMKKSAVDKEFRKLALEDPDKAVKLISGKGLPENEKIRFVENVPGIVETFVLPDFGLELSESDLENISGGWCVKDCCFGKGACETRIF